MRIARARAPRWDGTFLLRGIYLNAGFLLVGGTDSPVAPFNPFFEFYHFLTRDTISDGVYGADQLVTARDTLLRMITINYATLTGEADIKGTIEPGKLADFAVLSENLLTVDEKKIPGVRALLTYLGGREVFRDHGDAVTNRLQPWRVGTSSILGRSCKIAPSTRIASSVPIAPSTRRNSQLRCWGSLGGRFREQGRGFL